jgi:hypothetical protein
MLFGLRNAGCVSKDKGEYILPEKYAHSYGNGFYENFASCGLYKIDFDGLW